MHKQTMSSTNPRSKRVAPWLLAAAIGLCPAAAVAGTLGTQDTATGSGALNSENGGNGNTADGYQALYSNTIGYYNTATGIFALYSNTTGNGNTAAGTSALGYNTTGDYNAATGYFALYHNTTGGYNTASGYQALLGNSTGNNNVALGYQALQANTSGGGNVAVGTGALLALTGSHNIALGINAGKLTTAGDYNIYIGHAGHNGSESKVTRIGQSQTKTFIAGIKGVPLSGATVVVNSAGQLGVVASSARYKKDIKPLDDTADKLTQLRPVSFRYKTEPDATHYGLIAEEVDRVMPELVVRDEKNRPESVQYQELIPLLLQQWKEQRELNARQQAENARERAVIGRQQVRLDRQEAQLAELRRTLAVHFAALGKTTEGSGVK